MGDVIDFEENLAHCTGRACCWKCGKKWIAVFPQDATKLYCDCGVQVHRPPCNDDELIEFMLSRLKSNEASFYSIANNGVSTVDGKQAVRNWQHGNKAVIRMVEMYLEDLEDD